MRHLKKSDDELRQHADQNAPWDPELSEAFSARYRERYRARYNAWKNRRDDERRSRRIAYMASNAWWAKRCLVLERDAYRCQARLPGCTRRADEVHHLTYDNLGNEPLWDLISVCTSCHEAVTRMNGQGGGTG
jgi:5-methylcytosine-specific restriction endonuclease McrA